MERLSASSFVQNGHEFHLYSYQDISVPDGVKLKDAREILSKDEIFCYGENAGRSKGSFSAFSNLFRYELLFKKGGFWTDLDVICLKHFDFVEPYVFGREPDGKIGAAIFKAPAGSDFLQFCIDKCRSKDLHSVKYTEIGPMLVTQAVMTFKLYKFVKDPKTFYPLDWRHFADVISPEIYIEHRTSYAFHLWHEMWRKSGVDKNVQYPSNCLYEIFKKKFL